MLALRGNDGVFSFRDSLCLSELNMLEFLCSEEFVLQVCKVHGGRALSKSRGAIMVAAMATSVCKS